MRYDNLVTYIYIISPERKSLKSKRDTENFEMKTKEIDLK